MPDIPVYNECVTIHLPGPLDVPALQASLNEIIRRHEAWRTSFPQVNGLPVQKIHPAQPLPLAVSDLRALPAEQREAEALHLATEDARILFDLANGPLLRARLIHLEDEVHRLYLTLHHIIFDGVAIYQVFLPELRTFYEDALAARPHTLPEAPVRYSDYAHWQRERMRGDLLNDQLLYWKEQLAAIPAVLELPTDRPRPPIQTYRGSMQPFALSKRLTDALKALSRREGVTLYMTLVAAYNTLLYRYTGQEDMLIGTATAGRKRPESQKLMGFFLNTLVLRTDLSCNPTFRELLLRAREVVAGAVAHEDVPFEYVVKALQPERNLSQNPLFQVLLTLEPPLPVLPSGWTLTQMDVTVGTSKFDLSLELDDRPEGLIGRFEYNADLFDASTITRMVGHWRTLLESIVADPSLPIAQLPMLTPQERQQALIDWNRTAADYPRTICLHQLFEAQVERTPDHVALVFKQQRLTYRELNERANQLAHYLRTLSLGPETLVGLCVERSVEMLIGLLGILKAGGAYVPLDPTYPAERLAYMLEDSQAPVLVTQKHLTETLPTAQAKVVNLDDDAALLAQQPATNPAVSTIPDNLAYVIYTSGSTGRPKGVQIPHRAVVNFMTSMRREPGLSATDTLLAVTTLSFDIAALELFLPLTVGARLVVAPREIVADGQQLAEALTQEQVTVMQATPITWRLLLASGWQGDARLKALCGGEALPLELAHELCPLVGQLWNMYGPTETTIWSAVSQIEADEGQITIGHPIANTQLYLLDAQLQPIPSGVPGELYIGGDGLARGYLHRPELTEARFIPHPFSAEPDARLYKTGDLARYLPNGRIAVLGRIDNQVKLRGFRIEPGEIETVLEQHPAVREAVVVAREDTPGEKRLAAYVTTHERVSASDLISHAQTQLPAYMLPSACVFLEQMPLTPNGKIDRRALPAPSVQQQEPQEGYVAPTRVSEMQLAGIWEELLEARPIGIRDNFFSLGGHSLLAARLVDRIEQVFQQKLPLAALFTGPTIEQLANVLEGHAQAEPRPRAAVITLQTGTPGTTRKPFFFLHGDWYEQSFYCFALARGLGADQPFYVLEPYSFAGQYVPPTYEEMAAAHIEAMRTVQPQGPYLLGGFCSGGMIAFEMARQLRAQGEAVKLLALIEPGAAPFSLKFIGNSIQLAAKLLRRGPGPQLTWFLLLRHLYRYVYYAQYKNKARPPLIPSAEELRHDGTGIYAWLASHYIPREYGGATTFMWAREKPGSRKAGWDRVKTTRETYVIPGAHLSLLMEHLPDLIEKLKQCLDAAQRE